MKVWNTLIAVVFTMIVTPMVWAASPAGTWTTIDDATGKKRAVVNVSVSGGNLSATISKIFPQAGDTGICSKCPGNFKGKVVHKFGYDNIVLKI